MGNTAKQLVDPTVYPVEDDVGEHEIQTYILELLRPLIEGYLAARDTRAHVGSDQFIYWAQHEPTKCVAPDIYVLPGVPQDIAIDVWKIWERGVVPTFALEVVGRDPEKDYVQSPRRYAELGVEELVIFDPFPSDERRVFQLFRRARGSLRLIEATDGDRVRSKILGCHIRVAGSGAATRLRIATGRHGEELFPTAEEAALVVAEAAQAEAEAERRAKEAALRRVAELEAELARRRS
jgi:Uma2 family endonuclease